jgi:uncharacterized protein YbaA (DUF1428 family)
MSEEEVVFCFEDVPVEELPDFARSLHAEVPDEVTDSYKTVKFHRPRKAVERSITHGLFSYCREQLFVRVKSY